jgi:death-on-curing protein
LVDFLLKNILRFHEQLNAAAGIRDFGLIESAVNAPFQTFGGQSLYPSIFDKAARLGFGLTKNHGFIDGNKRVAAHALNVFLRINSFKLVATDDDFFNVTIGVAAGEISAEQLKSWLISHAVGSITFGGTITILSR